MYVASTCLFAWDFSGAIGAETQLTSQKLAWPGLLGYLVVCSGPGAGFYPVQGPMVLVPEPKQSLVCLQRRRNKLDQD